MKMLTVGFYVACKIVNLLVLWILIIKDILNKHVILT